MRKTYFIIALIFISETLFRLINFPDGLYTPFILNSIQITIDSYVYFLFEYVKVIGLVYILYIEKTQYRWLLYLFIADLAIYLLNYSSTLTYIFGIPIGMDMIKLVIFGGVILREALIYHSERSASNQYRSPFAYAHGHVFTSSWPEALSKILGRIKAFLLRINHRS